MTKIQKMAKNNGKMSTQKDVNFPKHSKNPFIDGWQLKKYIKSDTFPVYGATTMTFHKPVDYSKVTLYSDFFSTFSSGESSISSYSQLPKSSLYLLFYVLGHLRWGQDFLTLSFTKTDMPRNTFYRAVKDLADLQIIASRVGSRETYWINPRKIFHGLRFDTFRDNVTAKAKVVSQEEFEEIDNEEIDSQLAEDIKKYTT